MFLGAYLTDVKVTFIFVGNIVVDWGRSWFIRVKSPPGEGKNNYTSLVGR